MTLGKIISGLALLYPLSTSGEALAQEKAAPSLSIKTETESIYNPSRAGFTLQRTEVNLGNFKLKHDLRENLKGMNGATDVSMILYNDLLSNKDLNTSLALMNLGNFDGKDELFFDAYAGKNIGKIELGLELGTGVRKTAEPRHYFIATAKNFSLTDRLSASTEFGYLSKDPLQENKDRWYGYTALFTPEVFAAVGNEVQNTQVITGLNLEGFGNLNMYKKSRETGNWTFKTRLAYGDIDKGYFNTDFQQKACYILTIPSFFTTHFGPVWEKGDITACVNAAGDANSSTAMIGAGLKTDYGCVGIGTDTHWDSKGSNTGAYFGYYNTFRVLGAEGNLEFNLSGRTHQVDAYLRMKYVR